MSQFMSKEFLLTTEPARKLFHEHAEKMPIIDYHCHINPQEIFEDKTFSNLTQVWLSGDHYKWRLLRSAGVEEHFITGAASDREKFQKWAEVISHAIGNPVFHWSHLELQRFFGFDGVLNADTAESVWVLANEKLKTLSVRKLIEMSGVTHIATTDDPIDSLEWHERLAKDASFNVAVLPAWRPDKAMNIEQNTFLPYIKQLGKQTGILIESFEGLKAALKTRMDFFHQMGCRLSDHALEYVCYAPVSEKEIESLFARRLSGETPSPMEALQFKTAFMLFAGAEYARRGWAMQLHFGCKRNNNTPMFEKIGADTGFDCINNTSTAQLSDFLNALAQKELPRTILYSLNPADDPIIGTIIGCFQGANIAGKIQHGSAWWFNDHIDGMTNQIKSLANLGYLAGFVGMLTDSRSFLSYPRHEYFRRILCSILGEWVAQGLYPEDYTTLGQIVEDICYNNAVRYFRFPGKK